MCCFSLATAQQISAAVNDTSFAASATKVKACVSGAGTKVSWNSIPGAKYYRVYRSTSKYGKKKVIKKKTTKLYYKDKKGVSGKKYWYHVRAYNGSTWSKYATKKFRTVYRVYIETGHGIGDDGRWDSGCTWKGYQEAKLMIPIAQSMTNYLRRSGVYVYTDAYNSNNRNLNYTLDFLDSHSLSAFVNIHCDWSKATSGSMPLYRTSSQKKLAKALNKGVHQEVSIRDKGLVRRTDLTTLNSSMVHCPACLYETGSIKADFKVLTKKSNAYGKGLARGLCNYLGVTFKN